ncbi:hypothetical protein KRM28CT15_45470 [Krasilnikovia sp. M28-CT-15]
MLSEELVELLMAGDFVDTAGGLVAGNVAVTPSDCLHIFSDRIFARIRSCPISALTHSCLCRSMLRTGNSGLKRLPPSMA